VLGIEMNLIKKNNSYVITSATIFTLAIMAASSMAVAPALATTTVPASSSGIELSPEPVYQERQIRESRTAINETHFQVAISGNGTLTLPNTTDTISTTSTGSVLSALDGTATGKEVITTEDGSESATATTYGIARLEARRGIMIALFDTNSTGILAPLDGMILAGQIEYPPEETHSIITLWEWQSRIPLPTTTTPEELPPPTDTRTTTNATAADTNGAPATDGEQQQQQTTPIIPAPLLE
jgi:heme/copper-type cytochrome/quinol oxidase subunit 2